MYTSAYTFFTFSGAFDKLVDQQLWKMDPPDCLLQPQTLPCMGLLENTIAGWASTELGKQNWKIQLNTEG